MCLGAVLLGRFKRNVLAQIVDVVGAIVAKDAHRCHIETLVQLVDLNLIVWVHDGRIVKCKMVSKRLTKLKGVRARRRAIRLRGVVLLLIHSSGNLQH